MVNLDIDKVNRARADHLDAIIEIYNRDPELGPPKVLLAAHYGIEACLKTEYERYTNAAATWIMAVRYSVDLPNFEAAHKQLLLPKRLADLALNGRFAEHLLPAMQKQHALQVWKPIVTHGELQAWQFRQEADPWAMPQRNAEAV